MSIMLSIITPVYNGAEYIEDTIVSVLTNAPSDYQFEYIVVNDGSTDQTLDVLNQFYDFPNFFVINQPNSGEYAAVNNGLNAAKGNYILVVNADDPMLSSELIPSALDVLQSNPNIVCTYPDWQIINENGLVLDTKIVQEYSEEELVCKFNCLPGPGSIFRREEAIRIGGRRNWKFVSDYDFWLRLSRIGRFQRIPGVLAQWRLHQNSTSVSTKNYAMARERIDVIQSLVESNSLGEKKDRIALSSAHYFAARLAVFSAEIPAKRWMLTSFKMAKGWPKVANPIVVLFVFTLPLSKILLRVIAPYSKRLKAVF